MSAVYKKELKTYFTGMTGPVFICFILLMTGIFTVVYNLQGLYPNFEVTVNQVVFVYLLAIPVLTMRSIAEEKHSRTDQLLYSLPMSVTSIVIAKYLAMVTVLAIPVCVMAVSAVVMAICGTVATKAKIRWLTDYALPLSLVGGMASAIPITNWLG